MNELKNNEVFINDLVNAFPSIKDEVLDEEYAGLITLQIGCFKRFTQRAIDSNDFETVRKCFQFVDGNIGMVEHGIENALYISYLGKLKIAMNSNAERLLTNRLKNVVNDLDTYNTSASKNDKLNDFLNGL